MNRTEPESYQDFVTLPARVIGVIRSPRALFTTLVERPDWLSILLLTFLVSAGSRAALMLTDVGRLALIDQWELTALAFGRVVTSAEYGRLLALSEYGAAYAVLTAMLRGPLLALVVAGVVYSVYGSRGHHTVGASTQRIGYTQVLAVVAHAGVILALSQVVALPFNYARETLASPTTLGRLFPTLDAASTPARFLAALDLFVLWWAVVVAIGVAVLYRRPLRATVATFMGAYACVAALLAIAMAVTGGTA